MSNNETLQDTPLTGGPRMFRNRDVLWTERDWHDEAMIAGHFVECGFIDDSHLYGHELYYWRVTTPTGAKFDAWANTANGARRDALRFVRETADRTPIVWEDIPGREALYGRRVTVGRDVITVYRCEAGRWDVQHERKYAGRETGRCEMLAQDRPYASAMAVARQFLKGAHG